MKGELWTFDGDEDMWRKKGMLIAALLILTTATGTSSLFGQKKKNAKISTTKTKKPEFHWPSPLDPGKFDPLYKELPFGQPKEHFLAVIHSRLAAQLRPLLKATLDPRERDRLRMQMDKTFEQIKRSYIAFNGQDTGYSVSVVAEEFKNNAGESAFKYGYAGNTAYFFFSGLKLWKLFLCIESKKEFSELLVSFATLYGDPKGIEYADEEKTKPVRVEWNDSVFRLVLLPRQGLFTCTRIKWEFLPMQKQVEQRRAAVQESDQDLEKAAEELLEEALKPTDEDIEDTVDQIIKQRTGKREQE